MEPESADVAQPARRFLGPPRSQLVYRYAMVAIFAVLVLPLALAMALVSSSTSCATSGKDGTL